MPVLPIILWPDAFLSRPCPAEASITGSLRQLAADMLETMYDAAGRGLAAPQIGALRRLFVMDTNWKAGDPDPLALVDPVIEWSSPRTVVRSEGCLSIPGIEVAVTRPAEVRMHWTDLDGSYRSQLFQGSAATVVQHELDHLDGVVTLDRVDSVTRDGLIRRYETGGET